MAGCAWPETADGNAAAEIEIAFAGDIKNVAARAVAQDDFETSVARARHLREQSRMDSCWLCTMAGGTMSFICAIGFAIDELIMNFGIALNRNRKS